MIQARKLPERVATLTTFSTVSNWPILRDQVTATNDRFSALRCYCQSRDIWSRQQESNLHPTLRRHVHYPLCYGETGGAKAVPSRNYSRDGAKSTLLRRVSVQWRLSSSFCGIQSWQSSPFPTPNWPSATLPCSIMPSFRSKPASASA